MVLIMQQVLRQIYCVCSLPIIKYNSREITDAVHCHFVTDHVVEHERYDILLPVISNQILNKKK